MIIEKNSLDLSIILPTFNEEKNISIIINEIIIFFSKTNIKYQIIICDGCSTDNTINECFALKKKYQKTEMIILKSFIRKDITKSVLSGIEASFAKYIAVMDSDGQHRVKDLISMYNLILQNKKDLIIGSRNLEKINDSVIKSKRKKISVYTNKLINFFFRFNLSDPLSGFFIIKRTLICPKIFINEISGFKILFHLMIHTNRNKSIIEYPIKFEKRKYGESKLDIKIGYNFLIQFLTYLIPFNLPFKFVSFLTIGSFGVIIHMSIFYLTLKITSIFYVSHLIALTFASINNFYLNNNLTFSDNKLIGTKNFLNGVSKYTLIAIITITGSTFLSTKIFYYGISAYIATIIGALIDSVFKFVVVQNFIWKKK